jgi:hypothetical protein
LTSEWQAADDFINQWVEQRTSKYAQASTASELAALESSLLPPAPQQKAEAVPVIPHAPTPTIGPEDLAAATEHERQPTCPECGGEIEIVETLAKARRNGGPQIDTS